MQIRRGKPGDEVKASARRERAARTGKARSTRGGACAPPDDAAATHNRHILRQNPLPAPVPHAKDARQVPDRDSRTQNPPRCRAPPPARPSRQA